MISVENISGAIRFWRKQKGMKQSDLADALHTTQQAVSEWEREKTVPSIDLIPSIADALNISVGELVLIPYFPKDEKYCYAMQIGDFVKKRAWFLANILETLPAANEAEELVLINSADFLRNEAVRGIYKITEYDLTPKDYDACKAIREINPDIDDETLFFAIAKDYSYERMLSYAITGGFVSALFQREDLATFLGNIIGGLSDMTDRIIPKARNAISSRWETM